MAASRRVGVQHEDWLNLVAPEPPWFTLPVMKRAFANGLDPAPSHVRAEHKDRWRESRDAADRADYVEWLLRDGLGWRADYRSGSDMPPSIVTGVPAQGGVIVPAGVYMPAVLEPFDAFEPGEPPEADPAAHVLVFVLPAGCDPAQRPGDGWSATWIQRAAKCCRHCEVPLALVTDGDYLTLVYADRDSATGAGTWRAAAFESEPILLDSFTSMLAARRFTAAAEADTPAALLAESVGSQAEVADQLGWQARRAVELLVNAVSRADLDSEGRLLAGVEPRRVYEAAVTVVMRLVILLVAEEKALLPVDEDLYQRLYSVRTLREDLERERTESPETLEIRYSAWHRLLATARAVHGGIRHHSLNVAAYGSDLFHPERYRFLEGRAGRGADRHEAHNPIPVTDLDVLAVLDALMILRFRSESGVTDTRRLSYRELEVEQIGHVYERLLDHNALRANVAVLGCAGRPGAEPEVPLPDLEAARIDGEDELVAFLTDAKGNGSGHYAGTERQVRQWLAQPVPEPRLAELRAACGGDPVLFDRVAPFANLLRTDLRDRPVVFRPGAVYMTETGSNRASGTAYTTRALAEEVATHALAPLCHSPGPQDTADANQWRVRPSAELLNLKVCDPAVGSGAILVAACRYLADRVVDAWIVEDDPRAADLATAADDPSLLDARVQALRLVAERCCYGVDRNPMAVEMAKVSMWLTTLAKDQPFTFLDHAIKPGDSLLGVWDLDQVRWLHMDPSSGRGRARSFDWMTDGRDALDLLQDRLAEAVRLRRQLHEMTTATIRDADRKADLHGRSSRRLDAFGAVADLVTGAALASAQESNPSKATNLALEGGLQVLRTALEALDSADEHNLLEELSECAQENLDQGRPEGEPLRRPLHWPIAFPEVFADGGRFDAMVGNPPFIGGQRLSGATGGDYREYVVHWIAGGAKGSADLVAYFFLHAANIAQSLGYLATNTIAQGATSKVGLSQLLDSGWTIHRAVSSLPWPGDASLEIAKLWLTSESWNTPAELDSRWVSSIDEMLYPSSRSGWRKNNLAATDFQSFIGSYVLNMEFTVTRQQAEDLISTNPRNAEVLFPYLNGEDLNTSPTHSGSRWIINFFDWSEDRAQSYPECYEIVETLVKPKRTLLLSKNYSTAKRRAKYWWLYAGDAKNLYRIVRGMDRVLAIARVSKTALPAFVPTRQVFSDQLVIFAYDDWFHFGLLSSGFHSRWAIRYSSSLRTDPRYSPTDVFETFPQARFAATVAEAAEPLDTYRRELMVADHLGLTSLYNRVHDPADRSADIRKLRELHMALDVTVRDAYGWSELDLSHGFYDVRGAGRRFTFASEAADEILERLLELNRDRYFEEQRTAEALPLSEAAGDVVAGGLFDQPVAEAL